MMQLQSTRMNARYGVGSIALRASMVCTALTFALILGSCVTADKHTAIDADTFYVVMLPDTQFMLDYRHQKSAGFAMDAGAMFLQQMKTIAEWEENGGGRVAFVTSVGDVWEHQSIEMDPDHLKRGFKALDNPYLAAGLAISPYTKTVEMPLAKAGFQLLADKNISFGVAPGNHDYDAMWSAAGYPPDLTVAPEDFSVVPEIFGMIHIGGLDNFRSVFGDQTQFFAGKTWYVSSYRGGANSAQTFTGGGYTFLHIALEMQPSNEVLDWANKVIDGHAGTPTIITTHDFLDASGNRSAVSILDLTRIDPGSHNTAEQLWEKLISQRDEIFLVLSGHQKGQSRRIDSNRYGNLVYQVLADYQERGQSGLDAGQPMDPRRGLPVGIGDGWVRFLEFDLSGAHPRIKVSTYSTYYGVYASELPEYAQWYRHLEQPAMTEAEFMAEETFELPLSDFHRRFAEPQR